MNRNPRDHPAPDGSPAVSGAGRGQVEPPPAPARTVPAAVQGHGSRGTPSRGERGGTAGPGAASPGPAVSSPAAPVGAAAGAREEEPGAVTPGAGLPPAHDPAGGAPDSSSASPAGTTGLPGDGPRQWEITFPAGLELLSLNGREHYIARHRTTQELKKAAWATVVKAKVPKLDRITVTVVYDPPDGRHRDADNLGPTVKALLDGMALAILPSYGGKRRVVPGDDSRHVARVSLEIGPETFPRGRLRMIITEVPGARGAV